MKDASEQSEQPARLDELENYRRLVELQSQIVDLARRNRETERFCQLLRWRVESETIASQRKGKRSPFRSRVEHLLKRIGVLRLEWLAGRFRRRQESPFSNWPPTSRQSNTFLTR